MKKLDPAEHQVTLMSAPPAEPVKSLAQEQPKCSPSLQALGLCRAMCQQTFHATLLSPFILLFLIAGDGRSKGLFDSLHC